MSAERRRRNAATIPADADCAGKFSICLHCTTARAGVARSKPARRKQVDKAARFIVLGKSKLETCARPPRRVFHSEARLGQSGRAADFVSPMPRAFAKGLLTRHRR